MNHAYLAAVRAECTQTKVGRRAEDCRKNTSLQSNPRKRIVKVLKLSGVEHNFPLGLSAMFGTRSKVDGDPSKFLDIGSRRVPSCAASRLRAGAAEMCWHFVCCFGTEELRLSSWHCRTLLRVLLPVLKSHAFQAVGCRSVPRRLFWHWKVGFRARAGTCTLHSWRLIFVSYSCTECCESSSAKAPRWRSRSFSREDCVSESQVGCCKWLFSLALFWGPVGWFSILVALCGFLCVPFCFLGFPWVPPWVPFCLLVGSLMRCLSLFRSL